MISDVDRDLLDALVGWYETIGGSRPWKAREDVWESLIDDEFVARAPEGHVYPLPNGITFIHRSRARTKMETP